MLVGVHSWSTMPRIIWAVTATTWVVVASSQLLRYSVPPDVLLQDACFQECVSRNGCESRRAQLCLRFPHELVPGTPHGRCCGS